MIFFNIFHLCLLKVHIIFHYIRLLLFHIYEQVLIYDVVILPGLWHYPIFVQNQSDI